MTLGAQINIDQIDRDELLLTAHEIATLKQLSLTTKFSYSNLVGSYRSINQSDITNKFTEEHRLNQFHRYCKLAEAWGLKVMPVGETTVAFLNDVINADKAASEAAKEKYKRDLDFINKYRVENTKAIFNYTNIGIRSLVLSNGGAIIAILSLMGTIWKEDRLFINDLIPFVGYFCAGLSLILLVPLLAYYAQRHIISENAKRESICTIAAVSCALLSWLIFTIGSLHTISTITRYMPNYMPAKVYFPTLVPTAPR